MEQMIATVAEAAKVGRQFRGTANSTKVCASVMGRFRLVVIDLDGTLLTPAGQVTARVKAAIHRALGAGLLVCFATGRNWTESRDILEALEHYPTAVFVGGAMVVDTGKR